MTLYKPLEGTTTDELEVHRPKSPDFLLCHGYVALGEKYFLKELPKHELGGPTTPNSDYAISKFLSENSNVPVAKDMRAWEDSTSYWRLMERVPGITLKEAWDDLTLEQHRTIGTEIAEYLAEARKFTSTKPEAPDGQPLRDQNFGAQYDYVDLMTTDREEWWARMEPRINRSKASQEKIMKFKESYPLKEGAKYVLSHGDLNSSNIMVKDGHVTGIIDWEHGGYRPEWWEWNEWKGSREPTLNFIRDHPDRVTWREVLTEQMIRLGIDVSMPPDVAACESMCSHGCREPPDEEVPEYEYEKFDRYLYWKCTNYKRYMDDEGLSANYLAKKHKKRVKEEAKKLAIMRAFDKLSSDEQDIFLTGKTQRGSGNESQKPRNLDDDFEGLGI